MLEFLRNHQRYFFFLIAFVVITSFVFFGTFSAINEGGTTREDREIAKAVDGSSVKESEIRLLARFLATDQYDLDLKSQSPNLCNDGVIRNDLIKTGLADLIASSYFDLLQDSIKEKIDRVKRYKHYIHPQEPEISVLSVWNRFAPGITEPFRHLMSSESVTLRDFRNLSQLYLQQAACSPEFVKKLLIYQVRQNPNIALDPRIQYEDFSLCGSRSLTDWFGSEFLEISAEFIINGARAAESKGYRVSIEEAKGDLQRNFRQSIEKISQGKNRPELTLSQHLRTLGFDLKSAAKVWRSVLLFRRYFEGVGRAAFSDRLPSRDFESFVREAAVVQLYRWPSALQLRDLQDLVQLQLYIQSVSEMQDPLALPQSYLSLKEIANRSPELIGTRYRAKVATVDKNQLGLRATLKEMIEWTLEEKNWSSLRSQFSFLPLCKTREERFASLERLDPAVRSQLNSTVRAYLVEQHPEWIQDSLATADKEEKTIEITHSWTSLPWILNGRDLKAKLELGPVVSYSEDGMTFTSFDQVEKIQDEFLLTFREAKRRGILGQLADRFLDLEYGKIRSKHKEIFQTKEGGWKSLSQVKDEVAYYALLPLMRSIAKEGETYSTYAHRRLESYSNKALAALQLNPSDSRYIQSGEDPIHDQFKLEKKQQDIQRTAQEEWMKEQAFVMVPKQWSPVHISPDGEIAFFYFEEKKQKEAPIFDRISLAQQTLASDAKRYLAENLLEQTQKKGSITLLTNGGEE